MPTDRAYDLAVVGAGPAGLSAAIQAARSGLKTPLLPGGRLGWPVGHLGLAGGRVVERVGEFVAVEPGKKLILMATHSTEMIEVRQPEDLTSIVFCYEYGNQPNQWTCPDPVDTLSSRSVLFFQFNLLELGRA